MSERSSELDLFRILCCIGVLFYHVMDDVLAVSGAYFFWYGASFCVPGFFLLSGFLIGEKKRLEISYCERKIKDTLIRLFLWITFWAGVRLLFTGEITNIWEDFLEGTVSSGTLPVSWFLFTYCILMMFSYPLHKLMCRSRILFAIICVVWMAALACGMRSWRVIYREQIQASWLHLYLGYFAVGMLLARILPWIDKYISARWQRVISGGAFIFFGLFYCENVIEKMYSAPPHSYYGTWYYTGWLVCFFWFITKLNGLNRNKRVENALRIMARNTFSVYLGHLPVLLFVTRYYPIKTLAGAMGMILFLFVLWQLAGEIMRKMPGLRHLV